MIMELARDDRKACAPCLRPPGSIPATAMAVLVILAIACTEIWPYWDDEQIDSDEKTFSGGRHFCDFGDGLLQVAETYKIPAVDLYHTLGINKFNRTHYFPPTDGTHPNDIGRELLGNKVAAKLLGEY